MAVVEYKVSVKRYHLVECFQHFQQLELSVLNAQADPMDLKLGTIPVI